jgi:hypothetical protein
VKYIVTNNEDEQQIKRAEDSEKALQRGLEAIMNNELSRRWLYDRLQTFAHMDANSHVPGCSDSTAFNEGARSVGQAIIIEIRDTYPNQYMKMLEDSLFDD